MHFEHSIINNIVFLPVRLNSQNMRYYFIIPVILVLSVVCLPSCDLREGREFSRLVGKRLTLPTSCVDTTKNIFVHLIRGHNCTACKIYSLYIWQDVISMMDNSNMSFLFVLEPLPKDNKAIIQEAIKQSDFASYVYVDYSHIVLKDNPWLLRRRNKKTNNFVLNKQGKIMSTGDPTTDIHYLLEMMKM